LGWEKNEKNKESYQLFLFPAVNVYIHTYIYVSKYFFDGFFLSFMAQLMLFGTGTTQDAAVATIMLQLQQSRCSCNDHAAVATIMLQLQRPLRNVKRGKPGLRMMPTRDLFLRIVMPTRDLLGIYI
jgi:hypothetical protein